MNELISLQNEVKALRLQDKLGKQNFYEDMKKVFEPVTDIVKDVSKDVTKTFTETSKENNKALVILNDNFSETLNDGGIINSCFLSLLFKNTDPHHKSQYILVNDPDSNRVNDLLIKKQ